MVSRYPWTRHLLLISVIIFALGLMAGCGRDKSEEAAPEQEVAAEQAQPADAAEEPAQEEAAQAEPAQSEPAQSEPASEQPAEEQPAAADAAAEEGASEAPAEEAPVAEEAASEEVAASGNSTVQGACYHPYYPIRDGAIYHYLITTDDTDPVEMSTQYKVTGPDTFVTIQSFNDMSTEMSWRCTDEGLLNTNFGMSGLEMPGMEYTLENVAGTTVPLPDKLQPGSQWQSVFTMSGMMSAEGMDMEMSIDAVMDNTMTGFEDITVPAGTYKAAKVETTTTVDMQIDMGDMGTMAMPGMDAISMDSAMWLVDGVGMVKSMNGDEEWSTTTELVSIE